MRAEYTLAMRRESTELESALVDQRIDEAFERVYDYLVPAANYLREIADENGRRALEQLEWAYLNALKHAARSGLGCRAERKCDAIPVSRPEIPTAHALGASVEEATKLSAETDTVLWVRASG